ncbi:hypothetical protein HK100_005650 [Physocladia obscura]|uniref:Uncharacterized protein n=1 Tax=Physocladia obscura TaxID=109957 RepID=A0AAD5XD45_9FUNG|nr:hypothetical protein HK100_005650 [Physocladia obscura]
MKALTFIDKLTLNFAPLARRSRSIRYINVLVKKKKKNVPVPDIRRPTPRNESEADFKRKSIRQDQAAVDRSCLS